MDDSVDPFETIKALNRQPFRTWHPAGFFIERYELDKTPSSWMVTHHPPGHHGAVLRLKVRTPWLEESDWFVCEVQPTPCDPFQRIASGGGLSYFCLTFPQRHEQSAREIYAGFPAEWRSEFWQMARRIAAVLEVIDLAFPDLAEGFDDVAAADDFDELLDNSEDLGGFFFLCFDDDWDPDTHDNQAD